MTEYLKDLWSRVTVHWHVLLAAVLAALPGILDYLGVIDIRPLLEHFLPDNWVNLIVAVLPFVLMFLKPMIAVEPVETEE
jgi:hypothetical protein